MNAKTWTKNFFFITIIILMLIAFVNYIVNPFGIFNSQYLKYESHSTLNQRYKKIDYLDKYHNRYNSYMFGSSRMGVTSPSTLEEYIPNSKFYNFALPAANLYDYNIHLEYFLKKKYPIKNLYLQLDISDMNSYNSGATLHPHVLNSSINKFFLEMLFGFFPKALIIKLKNNFYNKNNYVFSLETGVWSNPYAEDKILENHDKYVKNEFNFSYTNSRTVSFITKNKIKESLKNIIHLCKLNNIKLYLFTTPHNKSMMDTFIVKDYLDYLKFLSTITEFYDFSGYNYITTNNYNYYEFSHYRPIIGEKIAKRIFDSQNIKNLNKFGVYINKKNINKHLIYLKEQIRNYQLNNSTKH